MVETFSGRGVGKKLLPYLRSAKESLHICSPYLSKKYTSLIKKKVKEGVKTTLITSASDSSYHQKALNILGLAREKQPDLGVIIAIIFSFLFVITIPLGIYAIWKFFVRTSNPPEELRYLIMPRSKHLIHSKIYIVDEEVSITGSANLTYSGMHKNDEYIEVKKEKERVNSDLYHFKKIWGEGWQEYS